MKLCMEGALALLVLAAAPVSQGLAKPLQQQSAAPLVDACDAWLFLNSDFLTFEQGEQFWKEATAETIRACLGADLMARDEDGRTALHHLSRHGNVEAVKELLAAGADPNAPGSTFCLAPLHLVKTPALVEVLVAAGADPKAVRNDGSTPLHEAAASGNSEAVRTLIAAGADPKAVSDDGNTPLHSATARWVEGDVSEAVRALIAVGVDLNAVNDDGHTALLSRRFAGDDDSAKLLIAAGADRSSRPADWTELHGVAAWGDPASVRALVAAGADMSALDEIGRSALHIAAGYGNADTVKELVALGADPNARTNAGLTPLHYTEDPESAQALIAAGADPNARDERGRTPLHHLLALADLDSKGAVSDYPAFVKVLLDAGANPNARSEVLGFSGTLLHEAAESRHAELAEVVKMLLAAGADLNQRENGDTPFDRAVYSGHLESTRALIAAGADPKAPNEDGRTPLHQAARGGNTAAVRLLIDAGAAVDARTTRGVTPLHEAARIWSRLAAGDYLGSVQILTAAGANPNVRDRYEGSTPLHVAAGGAEWENAEIVHAQIASGGDPKTRDGSGNTPLHAAVRRNNQVTVAALLAGGADPSARNEAGATPLTAAVRQDKGRAAYALLSAGAHPNATDSSGNVPLHYAAARRGDEWVRLLVAAGADPTARTATGLTPLHLAARAGDAADSVEDLLAAGADPNSRTEYGSTPLHSWAQSDALHEALRPGTESVPALLLEAGADARAKNMSGETPWDILQRSPHLDRVRGSDAYWLLNNARFNAPAGSEVDESDQP